MNSNKFALSCPAWSNNENEASSRNRNLNVKSSQPWGPLQELLGSVLDIPTPLLPVALVNL
jgi:hypothetical protein